MPISRLLAAYVRCLKGLQQLPADSTGGTPAGVRLLFHFISARIRLALAVSAACALLLQPVPAFSHECDQYTLPDGRDFADLGPYFSRIVHGAVVDAVAHTNAMIGSALEAGQSAREIEELQSADFISGEVWGHLFGAMPALEILDITLASESVRAQYPGLITMYRPVNSIYDDPLMLIDITKFVRTFFRAGTVSAGGVLFGTDKIIHFINLGRIYHSKYINLVMQGMPEEQATRSAFMATSRNPLLSEDGVLGLWSTGIHSNADLAADYAGLKFYRNLTEPVRIGTRLMPPMLQRSGPYWRVQAEPDSDFFTAFITQHWNEVLNPNRYLLYIGNRMRTLIRDRCADVADWYRDELGRPLGRAQFEAVQQELATFYGEEYGYSISTENPVSVASVCFTRTEDANRPESERDASARALDQTPRVRYSWGSTAAAAATRDFDSLGRNALWWAAAGGRAGEVLSLVVLGEKTNLPDSDGEAPLHAAARSGDAIAVQVLLAYGANPNLAALYGVTPLMLAASGGHTEVAAALLRAGANPAAQDLFGKTALHMATLRGNRPLAGLLLVHGTSPEGTETESADGRKKAENAR